MKTLIVDDEPIARSVLREELAAFPGIEIVGEAENGRQALQQIEDLRPDLVLLDLQMPVMGGFEVVRSLAGGHLPVVVIVTAFDDHAIEAFETGAIDYLLKPVSEQRLRKAVERAQTLRGSPIQNANAVAHLASVSAPTEVSNSPGVSLERIVGRNRGDYFLLNPDDILAFQADGELVWIVTAGQRLLATQSLRLLEQRLQGRQFHRVHRNAIVNVRHVRKMSALSSQRWLVTLSNSLQVIVSKRMAHSIRSMLRW